MLINMTLNNLTAQQAFKVTELLAANSHVKMEAVLPDDIAGQLPNAEQLAIPQAADSIPMTVPPQAPPAAAPVAAVPPAPEPPAATLPTTAPAYTQEQIALAAAQIMDAGRQAELIQLLGSFGVQAVTQLPQEQYGAFATSLRGMGARI